MDIGHHPSMVSTLIIFIIQTAILRLVSYLLVAPAGLSVALPARAEKEIATAGTGNPTLTTGDAPDSICPYGWRLPDVNIQKELMPNMYRGVSSYYQSDTFILSSPLSFVRAGFFTNGISSGNGGFWTSTLSNVYGTIYVASTSFGSGSLYLPGNGSRSSGTSLRCLAR